jgi:hypothetical protein
MSSTKGLKFKKSTTHMMDKGDYKQAYLNCVVGVQGCLSLANPRAWHARAQIFFILRDRVVLHYLVQLLAYKYRRFL